MLAPCLGQYQPIQQPHPPDLGSDLRVLLLHLCQSAPKVFTFGLDIVEKTVCQHDPKRCHCSRAGHRVAAKGRGMGAGDKSGGQLLAGQHRPDRQTVAKRLGNRHDIGHHTELLIGKQGTRPAHSGLHFIENKQQIVLITECFRRTAGIL